MKTKISVFFIALLFIPLSYSSRIQAAKSPWTFKNGDAYLITDGTARKKDGTELGGSGSGITGPGSATTGGIPVFADVSAGTLSSSGFTIVGDILYSTGGKPSDIDPSKVFRMYDDFCATSTSTWDVNSGSTGTVVGDNVSDSASNPCIFVQATGTTLKSYTSLRRSYVLPTGGIFHYEAVLKLHDLSDGTDEYDYFAGLQNSVSDTVSTDSVTLRYDRNTSVNWIMQTCNNSTCTNTASSVSTSSKALVTTGYHRYGFVTNAGWTSTTFYVDGEAIGTVATNHPAAGRIVRPILKIVGNVGTTSRTVSIDYIDMRQVFTTVR